MRTRSDSHKHTHTHARRHQPAGNPPDSPRSWLAPFLCCPFPFSHYPTTQLCHFSGYTQAGFCLSDHRHTKAPTAPCPALPTYGLGAAAGNLSRPCLGPLSPMLGPSSSLNPNSLTRKKKTEQKPNLQQQLLPLGGVSVPSRTPFMICAPPRPCGLKPFVYGTIRGLSDPGLKPSPPRPACGPPRHRHTGARVGSGSCKPGRLWEKQEGGKSKMGWSWGGCRSQAEC